MNVPAYDWWSEALHGVAVDGTTEFPEPIGLAATFDTPRIHEMATTVGIEARIVHAQMFGTTQQFNFTAQLGGGVQLFTSSRRTAIDLGYKYHHISNANLANHNPGLDSHMLFIGLSVFR